MSPMNLTDILNSQTDFRVAERNDIRFHQCKAAAEAGDPSAQNNLGICYAIGINEPGANVDIDREKAEYFFRLAAQQDLKEARDNYKKIWRPPPEGLDIKFASKYHDADPLKLLYLSAREEGIAVSLTYTDPYEIRASLSPATMTALALFLLSPLYNDLYQWFKKQVPGLWEKIFDPKNKEGLQGKGSMVSVSPGGVTEIYEEKFPDYSFLFSIAARCKRGTVILIFPAGCSKPIFTESVLAFADLLQAYKAGKSYNGIDLDGVIEACSGIAMVTYKKDGGLQVLSTS